MGVDEDEDLSEEDDNQELNNEYIGRIAKYPE
jgi:hypothetical protein